MSQQVYLPMDCPICGRRRVEWNGIELRCEKCTTSSEWDGFTVARYGTGAAYREIKDIEANAAVKVIEEWHLPIEGVKGRHIVVIGDPAHDRDKLTLLDAAALRKYREDCDKDYAVGDGPVPSRAFLAALDKVLAAIR